MELIKLAERHYEKIWPKSPKDPQQHWSPQERGKWLSDLEAWLLNFVCPAVAESINRPRFREQATWSLEKLQVGAGSEERQRIEAVDRSLVECAKALVKLAKNAPLDKALKELCPLQEVIVKEEVLIGSGSCQRISAEKGTHDALALEHSQVKGIAGRCWTDLVFPGDYFYPLGGMMMKAPPLNEAMPKPPPHDGQALKGPQIRPHWGNFIVSLNPKMLPIGDFISRTMLQRVEIHFGTIASFRDKCLAANAKVKRPYPKQIADVEKAWEQLEADYQSLQSIMLAAPAVQIRESCVTLTQVYAAFHPSPNLYWLDLPPEAIESEAAILKERLMHSRGDEIAERIATALSYLHQIYATDTPEEAEKQSAINEAIANRDLVLIQEPRKAYWDGEPIEVDWYRHKQSWRFLMALARKATRRSPVGWEDLFGNDDYDINDDQDNDKVTARSAMSTAFGRLKSHLPPDLWKYIQPDKHQTQAYVMDLPPGRRAYIF